MIQNWNTIGWIKTVIIIALIVFELTLGSHPTHSATVSTALKALAIGLILTLANVYLGRIFQKQIIEEPSWNNDPLHVRYPLGLCSLLRYYLRHMVLSKR